MMDKKVNFSATVCNSQFQSEINMYGHGENSESANNLFFEFSSSLMPEDIFALAKAFLSISEMTNKKLQKLCYYAKAWYLALYDTNLITEQFQAWVHGAVQPALYQQYKRYGYNNIPQFTNVKEVPETFLEFAREIYDSYGHLSGDELEKINHLEEPWMNARKGCKPWENCENEISEQDMKEYYRKMIV